MLDIWGQMKHLDNLLWPAKQYFHSLVPVFQFQEQFLVHWFMEALLRGETACVSGNRVQNITFYFSCVNTKFLSQIYCNQQSNQMLTREVFGKMYWKMSISSTENYNFFPAGNTIDCFECNSWDDPRCHDPWNWTYPKVWWCWYCGHVDIDISILWIYQHCWCIVTMVLLILWIYWWSEQTLQYHMPPSQLPLICWYNWSIQFIYFYFGCHWYAFDILIQFINTIYVSILCSTTCLHHNRVMVAASKLSSSLGLIITRS